ncbi:MAG TPA: tetratricopeptide repeat protein [Elusimicrobiota bacterium]|nr:tetratricopeptide repeat protein [Elusimicrobiota bacterium]
MRRFPRSIISFAILAALLALTLRFFHLFPFSPSTAGDPLAHQRAGEIALGAGELPQAEQEFKTALRLYREEGRQSGSDYADSLQRLAQVYAASGEQKKAAGLLEQAAQDCGSFSPMWAWIIIHRAEILDALGQKSEAEHALTDARQRCSSSPGCTALEKAILRLGQAQHAVAAGRPKEASTRLSALQASLKKNRREFATPSDCSDAIAAAAMALDIWEGMDDWSTARQAGRGDLTLLACNPQSTHAMDILLKMGAAEAACGDTAKAEAFWHKALSDYSRAGNSAGAKHVRYILNNIGKYASPWTSCAPE